MTVDLDQGGHPAQKTRVYLGPSLGWTEQQVLPERQVQGSGIISIDPGDSVILLSADGPCRLNLPDVRTWIRQTANQPATGFGRAIWIKDFAGRATTFPIVVFPFGTQVIDGIFQSLQFSSNYQTITFYPMDDEDGWYTVVQSAGGAGGGGVTVLNPTAPLSGSIVGATLNLNIAYDANFALAGSQLALSNAPAGFILGNAQATSAEPVATSLTNVLDRAFGNSQGTIIFRSAGAWVPLAPGTSGQFLATGGTTGNPSWMTVTPGGAGNVSSVGTPTVNQIATWTDPTHIQGVDKSTLGFQPLDGDLTSLSGLTGTNTIYYRSNVDTWSPVIIGANLTFSGGTLSATGGGGGGLPEAPTDGHLYLRQGSPAGWVDNALVNQPADGDLTSLAAATGTNTIYYRSGASTWTAVNIGPGLSFGGGTLSATGLADGDKGDITVTGSGATWTIDAKAVDTTKMADMPQGSVIGRLGGAGTGAPGYISPSQVLDVIGSNQGMMLYRAASGWTALAAGTSGQILQTQGVGNNPIWVTPAVGASLTIADTPPGSPLQGQLWWESDSGKLYVSYNDGNSTQWVGVQAGVPAPQPGSRVLLATLTPSGSSNVLDTPNGIFTTRYDRYEIDLTGLQHAGNANAGLSLRYSFDNGASYPAASTNYTYEASYSNNVAPFGGFSAASGAAITICAEALGFGGSGSGIVNGELTLYTPTNAVAAKFVQFKCTSFGSTLGVNTYNGGGWFGDTGFQNPVTNLRFFWSDSSNFTATGNIKVYGIV